jgi:2-hydroxychromene-2-carboxylate isomerase
VDRLPAFYFDLASLEAYLSAERILSLMPAPVEWVGVGASGLAAPSDPATQVELARDRIASRGLQELRLPDPFPFDSRRPMLAATYARQIGRAVPFALAAWRQSFAAGRTLDDDGIAIAGSSCEMHPTALLKAIETATVADELEAAGALAREREVRDVPAVWVPGQGGEPDLVFHGDDELEAAAAAVGERVPSP